MRRMRRKPKRAEHQRPKHYAAEMTGEDFDELVNLLADVCQDAIESKGITTSADFASLPLSEFRVSTIRVIERINAEKEQAGAPDRLAFDPVSGTLSKFIHKSLDDIALSSDFIN